MIVLSLSNQQYLEMSYISVTRLKVKSIFLLPAFMKANEASVKSMKGMHGFMGGSELIDRGLVFWTLTMWDSEASMRVFRNGPAHRAAMQRLPDWCNEAAYVHWLQEDAGLPDWAAASKRLLTEGKLTKVKTPSAAHAAGSIRPLRWTRLVRPLKP